MSHSEFKPRIVPVRKTAESSSDSDSDINTDDERDISQRISNAKLKNAKVTIQNGILRRLTDIFRRHPDPSPKRIKKLSQELSLSQERILGWFKVQRRKEHQETEKIKGTLFHLLMHSYLQRVCPIASSAFTSHLKVHLT